MQDFTLIERSAIVSAHGIVVGRQNIAERIERTRLLLLQAAQELAQLDQSEPADAASRALDLLKSMQERIPVASLNHEIAGMRASQRLVHTLTGDLTAEQEIIGPVARSLIATILEGK